MMKKYLLWLTICAFIVISGCQHNSEQFSDDPSPFPLTSPPPEAVVSETLPTPERFRRELDWNEDIEFLRQEYKAKHADPFYLCSEEEFDWKLDQLSANVSLMSDTDIFFELTAIIAGMGDTHSGVLWDDSLPAYDRLFPISIYYFGDRMYLTGCHENYEQLVPYLLHEIVAVNGVDITYLFQKAASLNMCSNRWYSKSYIFFTPAFFDWAGCDYKEGYTFQILNDNREVESVEIPVVTPDEWERGTWIHPKNWDSLSYLKGGNWAEYLEGKDGGCVYMSLAELEYSSSIWLLLDEVSHLLETHPNCNKLAVDFRMNPGGYSMIVEEVQRKAQMLEGKQIYVLTGGVTASAATTFMAYFKGEFDAVIVGEPTAQFSSFFRLSSGSVKPSVLPHSQLRVQIADSWRDSAVELPKLNVTPVFEEYYDENGKLYEWENTILPDVFVYQDIEDIRQGKDSVIEWILAQQR